MQYYFDAQKTINQILKYLNNDYTVILVYDMMYHINCLKTENNNYQILIHQWAYTDNEFPGTCPDYENDPKYEPYRWESYFYLFHKVQGKDFLAAATAFVNEPCFDGLTIMDIIEDLRDPKCINIFKS